MTQKLQARGCKVREGGVPAHREHSLNQLSWGSRRCYFYKSGCLLPEDRTLRRHFRTFWKEFAIVSISLCFKPFLKNKKKWKQHMLDRLCILQLCRSAMFWCEAHCQPVSYCNPYPPVSRPSNLLLHWDPGVWPASLECPHVYPQPL